jgi:hypothetical protein
MIGAVGCTAIIQNKYSDQQAKTRYGMYSSIGAKKHKVFDASGAVCGSGLHPPLQRLARIYGRLSMFGHTQSCTALLLPMSQKVQFSIFNCMLQWACSFFILALPHLGHAAPSFSPPVR